MSRSRWLRAALAAAPALALAGLGAAHPGGLNGDTASWWATLHILLLPVFPLLAAAQWFLLASAPPLLRLPGRLAAYGFATFYSGLDAVAGVAAGTVEEAQGGASPVLGQLFEVGDRLGHIGAWCFLVASALIVADIAPHARWRVVPGAVLLLASSVSFLDSHLFWPRGVYTMIGIAAGMFLLSYVGSVPAGRDSRPSRADWGSL